MDLHLNANANVFILNWLHLNSNANALEEHVQMFSNVNPCQYHSKPKGIVYNVYV